MAIVDYGVGNIASLARTLESLDYKTRLSCSVPALNDADVTILPGVGAFPTAMDALHARDLVGFLLETAHAGRPMIGICLGMQLLADSSTELRQSSGLGIIPGQVVPISRSRWHIGWNTIEVVGDDPLMRASDGQALYFNHSYILQAPPPYQIAVARLGDGEPPLTVGVRRGQVVGLQFHPEKSQRAGHRILRNVIEGLCSAQ